MARVDEAVARVLQVKLAYRLPEKPRPAQRTLAGKWELLGSPAHRALAREAVRKSLVLLKNDGVLPLRSTARVLVAGKAADSIPRQAGGWSLTWQGGGALSIRGFPGATSIFAGFAAALAEGGGRAVLSADGSHAERPDVAVVVLGEEPYAEFVGDREDGVFRNEEGLALLRKFHAEGIPTVAVLLSGRPLWLNRELEFAGALVAAWLPGSEGAGVADVMVGTSKAKPRYDFAGRLSFPWPLDCKRRMGAVFPYGAGWSYAAQPPRRTIKTRCALLERNFSGGLRLFERRLNPAAAAGAQDSAGAGTLANLAGSSRGGDFRAVAFDRRAQEDARHLIWQRPASLSLTWKGVTLPRNASVVLDIRAQTRPSATLSLAPLTTANGRTVDLTSSMELAAGKGWRRLTVPLACFGPQAPEGLVLTSAGPFEFEIDSMGIMPGSDAVDCKGPF